MNRKLTDHLLPDQQAIQKNLTSNLAKNHLGHALLLTGQKGGGQLLHALFLAGEILKSHTKPEKQERTLNKGYQLIHPDLHFLFPLFKNDQTVDENMNVFRKSVLSNPYLDLNSWSKSMNASGKLPTIYRKSVHGLLYKLGLKPYEGNARVSVIWLPEYLGLNGNVLLKILEEPPKNTYFILVSEKPENIISTVLSRCQRIQVPSFTVSELESIINHLQGDEPRDNQDLLFAAEGDVNYVLKNTNLTGYSDTTMFRTWMQSCYRQKFDEVIKVNEEIAGQKKDGVLRFLYNGLRVFRECLSISVNPEKAIAFPIENREFIKKLSLTIPLTAYPELNKIFNEHIYQIERNLNAKIVLLELATLTGSAIKNMD